PAPPITEDIAGELFDLTRSHISGDDHRHAIRRIALGVESRDALAGATEHARFVPTVWPCITRRALVQEAREELVRQTAWLRAKLQELGETLILESLDLAII